MYKSTTYLWQYFQNFGNICNNHATISHPDLLLFTAMRQIQQQRMNVSIYKSIALVCFDKFVSILQLEKFKVVVQQLIGTTLVLFVSQIFPGFLNFLLCNHSNYSSITYSITSAFSVSAFKLS